MAPAVTETHAWLKKIRKGMSRSILPDPSKYPPVSANEHDRIRRVLIIRPVHSLGNLLGLTPLLTELETVLPLAEVDIVAGVPMVDDIVRHYPQVRKTFILPRHALRHPVTYLGQVRAIRRRRNDLMIEPAALSSSARLLAALSKGRTMIATGIPTPLPPELDTPHFAHRPVNLLRYHLPWASLRSALPAPPLNLRLQAEELAKGEEALNTLRTKHGLRRPGILALFTHATWKKAYPSEWWRSFLDALVQRFKEHDMIEILPAHGESRLDHVIPTVHSMNIRELGAILANCSAFIGADSGIVHLASASGIPTFSLFNVTDPTAWRPYGPRDLDIETEGMSAEDVAEKIKRKLDGNQRGAAA